MILTMALANPIGPGCVHLGVKMLTSRSNWYSGYGWEARIIGPEEIL